MKIDFDAAKNEKNIQERGISFESAAEIDWETALVGTDRRKEYGEPRYKALGFIEDRLHVLVFTVRKGGIRVISLRKANRREEREYEKTCESRIDR
jgi:uncharacterized DUF497 family protein